MESVRASNTGEVWAIDHGSQTALGVAEGQLAREQQDAGPQHELQFGKQPGDGRSDPQASGWVHLLNQDAQVDPEGMSKMAQWLVKRSRAERLGCGGPHSLGLEWRAYVHR